MIALSDPAAPTPPPYMPPASDLCAFVRTLPRPSADAPASAWRDAAQAGLDKLGALDPHDAAQAMLAMLIVSLEVGAMDTLGLAQEPTTPPAQAQRSRAQAATQARVATGMRRELQRLRAQPAPPPRDWGEAAATLVAPWQAASARPAEPPRGAAPTAAAAAAPAEEPEEIIRWIDEIDDAELAVAVEIERRARAGEPPLPRGRGAKVVYRYKPDDPIRTLKLDPGPKKPYPGWENMTLEERRVFFGYEYDGPLAPPEMIWPPSQVAGELAEIAAAEAAAAEARAKAEAEAEAGETVSAEAALVKPE
jgi:hypothetical protein